MRFFFVLAVCFGLVSPGFAATTEERLDALELDVFQLKEIHGLNPVSCDTLARSVELDDPHINQGPLTLCNTLTITVRVNAASWSPYSRVIDMSGGSADQDADAQLTASNGSARARFCAGGSTVVLVGGTITTEDQRWDLSYDGATVRLYLDGQQVTSAPKTGVPCNRGFDMWIGGTSAGQQFDGYMYNVEVRDFMDSAAILAEHEFEVGANPPPPPTGDFATACAGPSVVYCNGFDTQADKDRCGGDTSIQWNLTHKIAIDAAVFFEGAGALRLTIDDNNGFDMAGTLSCDHPDITSGSVFYSWQMRTGNNLQAIARLGGLGTFSGLKYFQATAGTRSCNAEEITLYDQFMNNWSTGALGMVPTCSGKAFHEGADWQPVSGNLDNCGYTYFAGRTGSVPNNGLPNEDPPCDLMTDDTWHAITLEIKINQGVSLWLDNKLIISQGANPDGIVPVGPYGYVHFDNYGTGHSSGEMVARQNVIGWSPVQSLFPVYYDNFMVSTECVTGC